MVFTSGYVILYRYLKGLDEIDVYKRQLLHRKNPVNTDRASTGLTMGVTAFLLIPAIY